MESSVHIKALMGFAFVLFASFAFSPGSGPASPDPGLSIPFPEAPFDGCIGCLPCGFHHETGQRGPLDDYSGEIHDCPSGWGSCTSHGICGGGEEENEIALVNDLEAIRRAFLNGEIANLRSTVHASPRVTILASRQAIQVFGCKGKVVAHFPLDQVDFATLND